MPNPIYTFTRESIRQLDRIAISQYWMPGILLMENASRSIAECALELLGQVASTPPPPPHRVLVVCGGGNNGGDGFGAARHLHNNAANVTIALAKPANEYKGDAMMTLKIAQKMAIPIIDASQGAAAFSQTESFDLVIDALLGTGLSEDIRPLYAEVIDWINTQPAPVLAVDIPSGLDCDTGVPLGGAVRAHTTVTLVGHKIGFAQPGAAEYTGKIITASIGAPLELIQGLGTLLGE